MSALSFEKLVLTNFKGFSGTHAFELSRAPGLYYITGKNLLFPELGANGVGKSTLWDAMFWCLFNKTIRDARPANAIVPWDDEKASSSVSLHFKRGAEYVLTRTRKPNSLQLTRRGKSIEIPQEDVALTLGVNEETFRRTVVLGQFGSLFLDLGPEQQAKMFSEALDLNVWLKAAEIASKRRTALSSALDLKQGELNRYEGRFIEIKAQVAMEEASSSGYERKKSEQIQEINSKLANYANEIKGLLKSFESVSKAFLAGGPEGGYLAPLKAEIASLRGRQRALARALGDQEGQLSALGARQGDLKARLASYRAALAGDKTCPECGQKAPITHLKAKFEETKKALDRSDNDVKVATADAAEDRGALSQVEDQLKLLEQAQTKLEAISLKQGSAQRDRKRLEEQTNPHEATISFLKIRRKTTREEITRSQEEIEQGEADVVVMEFWGKAFKEIRLSVIDAVLRELEMAVTRHVSALGLVDWRVEFQTERQTQSGSVSIAFTVLLYPPDATAPIRFESYSGGESQRLQLAMAFGLSEVLLERAGVSPSIEVLDEPTRGLSSQGVEDLLEHLSERARELERTIYFVDHHSLDRGAFDGVITITKDQEGSHIK